MRRPPTLAFALTIALAAGCGGGEERPATDPRAATAVVAALGDSITAGTPSWDPDPAVRSQIAEPDERSQYGYWAERALPGTRFRNCGINGQRTDEIARRLDDCAEGADVLIVQGGVNDIAQGLPPEGAAANLRAMVRRGKELGLRVAVVELLALERRLPGGLPARSATSTSASRR